MEENPDFFFINEGMTIYKIYKAVVMFSGKAEEWSRQLSSVTWSKHGGNFQEPRTSCVSAHLCPFLLPTLCISAGLLGAHRGVKSSCITDAELLPSSRL